MFGKHSHYGSIVAAAFFVLTLTTLPCSAVLPEELVINEVYYDNYTKDRGPHHQEAIELLVVKDYLNLNGLVVSDRDNWDTPTEFHCQIQDGGQGFLKSVRAGTLLVIYDGLGTDDIDGKDFTLTLYARSSSFCNIGGKTNAFNLGNYGDNVHVLHRNKQVDYLKFRPNDRPERGGHPGDLAWEKGVEGFIDVGAYGENVGIRYLGDSPDLNDHSIAWQAYSEIQSETNNLGKPNGLRNTVWIGKLRAQANNSPATKPKKKGPPNKKRPKAGATAKSQ